MAIDAELARRKLALEEADSIRKNEVGPHNAEIERYKVDLEIQFKYDELAQKMEMERYKADKSVEVAKLAPKPESGE
jgi:hypothetical protein